MKFQFEGKVYIARDWLSNSEFDILTKCAKYKDDIEKVNGLMREAVKSIIIDPKIESMDDFPASLTFEIIGHIVDAAAKTNKVAETSVAAGKEKFEKKPLA